MYAIGFDIGGTKIEAALVRFLEAGTNTSSGTGTGDLGVGHDAPGLSVFPYQSAAGRAFEGRILARERVPTERQNGYEPIVAKMANLVRGVCAREGLDPAALSGLGLAIPGAVDPRTLRMLNGNTLVLKDRDLVGDLRAALGLPQVPVRAENDANCFALGEALCGAGLAHARAHGTATREHTSVGIILGTGCGGGVVLRGDTLRGRRGGAGELGHVVLHENGLRCWCGQVGCAEQYLSGSGLEQQFNMRRYSQVREFQDARAIFELARAGDPIAVACVKAFRADLARFLSQMTAVFDPDFFVLGGGVSLQDDVYVDLSAAIARQAFLPDSFVPVYRNRLGDSAGVVGASLLIVKDL